MRSAVRVSARPGANSGARIWRWRKQLRLTVALRATFGLGDGMPLVASEPLLNRALTEGDAPPQARAPSALAPHLAAADILLTGHACAPQGRPVQSLTIGLELWRGAQRALEKYLVVYGPRRPDNAVEPFTRVALGWERALPGAPPHVNPQSRVHAVAGPVIVDPRNPNRPAGLCALPRDWPARQTLLAGLDPRLLWAEPLELPDAFDWAYYQSAPPDQRVAQLFGDEVVRIHGMHPSGRMDLRLPSVRAEARLLGGPEPNRERPLTLAADVLHIDLDAAVVSLVFRGSTTIESVTDARKIEAWFEIGDQHRPRESTPAAASGPPAAPRAAVASVPSPPSSSPASAGAASVAASAQGPASAPSTPSAASAASVSSAPSPPKDPVHLGSTTVVSDPDTAVSSGAPPFRPGPLASLNAGPTGVPAPGASLGSTVIDDPTTPPPSFAPLPFTPGAAAPPPATGGRIPTTASAVHPGLGSTIASDGPADASTSLPFRPAGPGGPAESSARPSNLLPALTGMPGLAASPVAQTSSPKDEETQFVNVQDLKAPSLPFAPARGASPVWTPPTTGSQPRYQTGAFVMPTAAPPVAAPPAAVAPPAAPPPAGAPFAPPPAAVPGAGLFEPQFVTPAAPRPSAPPPVAAASPSPQPPPAPAPPPAPTPGATSAPPKRATAATAAFLAIQEEELGDGCDDLPPP